MLNHKPILFSFSFILIFLHNFPFRDLSFLCLHFFHVYVVLVVFVVIWEANCSSLLGEILFEVNILFLELAVAAANEESAYS